MNGESGMGGGSKAGRKTARTGWLPTHALTRFSMRAEIQRFMAASPPFLPSCQVVYPPMMLPATALKVSSQGFPLCETSRSRSRSVLPGMGRGTMEESTMATANRPSGPRRMSQWGRNERRAAGAGANRFTTRFDATREPQAVWRGDSTGSLSISGLVPTHCAQKRTMDGAPGLCSQKESVPRPADGRKCNMEQNG